MNTYGLLCLYLTDIPLYIFFYHFFVNTKSIKISSCFLCSGKRALICMACIVTHFLPDSGRYLRKVVPSENVQWLSKNNDAIQKPFQVPTHPALVAMWLHQSSSGFIWVHGDKMVKTTASKLRTTLSDHTYSMTHTSNLITWQRMQALEAVRCMKKYSARVVLPKLNLGGCHKIRFRPVKVILSDVLLSSETKVSKPNKRFALISFHWWIRNF